MTFSKERKLSGVGCSSMIACLGCVRPWDPPRELPSKQNKTGKRNGWGSGWEERRKEEILKQSGGWLSGGNGSLSPSLRWQKPIADHHTLPWGAHVQAKINKNQWNHFRLTKSAKEAGLVACACGPRSWGKRIESPSLSISQGASLSSMMLSFKKEKEVKELKDLTEKVRWTETDGSAHSGYGGPMPWFIDIVEIF